MLLIDGENGGPGRTRTFDLQINVTLTPIIWFKGLYEIGKRLGPFDVTFFEIGAYSNLKGQMEVHYSPKQAVKAHQAVRGKLMVPSGWGAFDLGLFPWYEPIERFLIQANQDGIDYLTPKIGEVVIHGKAGGREAWWKPYVDNKQ